MSRLVQLEGKHTTQTAHRALSVIAYIAIIANIVKNVNIVYIRQLVNIAKIATIVNIVKSVNSVNSVLKIVGKSVHEPETFFLRTDKEIGEKRKFILFDPLLGNEERYWDGP